MKTALITGATDGIGKATASKLLSEGWEVVIVGRNPSKCAATVAELRAANGSQAVSAITADLSVMADVKGVAKTFLETHDRLDLLMLNANAITQERVLTVEGFESNFALGHLGRALLTWQLQEVLETTPDAQVMTVVGLNVERPDFNDLTMAQAFSAQSALACWQWSAQVFTSEFNLRSRVPMNIYMPGLVKTKILANEPQPRRLLVKTLTAVVGISAERAARNVFSVMSQVTEKGARGETYAWKRQRKPLYLKLQQGDQQRLWEVTATCLAPFENPG